MRRQCQICITWLDNDEDYYWHFKIHNAELERAILNKQWELANKLEVQND